MARSLADYYRHHRAVMTLALELGVTPREAECELGRRAARDRWVSVETRLQAKKHGNAPAQTSPDDRWMMRD